MGEGVAALGADPSAKVRDGPPRRLPAGWLSAGKCLGVSLDVSHSAAGHAVQGSAPPGCVS